MTCKTSRNYVVTDTNKKSTFIHLPPKSVWLFKTPADVYYSKYDMNKCREFFDSTLKDMKKENKIKNYSYDSRNNTFTIEIDGIPNIKINLFEDNDTIRFEISNPNY